VAVAPGSIFTLANIELGSRSVNPDVGFGSVCACTCAAKPGSFASASIDAAAPAELFVEAAGFPFPTAEVVKGKFVVEKVPAVGAFEIAEAWQPKQLLPVGPLTGNAGSGHAVEG
jgi:hypothetical protein